MTKSERQTVHIMASYQKKLAFAIADEHEKFNRLLEDLQRQALEAHNSRNEIVKRLMGELVADLALDPRKQWGLDYRHLEQHGQAFLIEQDPDPMTQLFGEKRQEPMDLPVPASKLN